MYSRRLITRMVLLAVLMAGLIIAGAFPNVVPASVRSLFSDQNDDASPKAVLCREEAAKKFPADMQVVGMTPDGSGRTMINRNAKPYSEAYAECMKRR